MKYVALAARQKKTADDALPPHTMDVPLLVMVVEDEEPILMALTFILEDAGYRVLAAKHGREALDHLAAQRPALIFTDLMMPYMNGEELIAAVHAQYRDIPIVLMTAAGSRYSEHAGADRVLPKPFNIADVEAILEQML
jgi:two-component system, OmpR family, response regulator VicR